MLQSDHSKKQSSPVNFSLLMDDLTTHVDTKSNGNFFIVTDDNASCRFALCDGVITHCAFKRHTGLAALEAMLASPIRGVGRFSRSLSPLKKNIEAIDHEIAIDLLNIHKANKVIKAGQNQVNLAEQTDESAAKPKLMYRGQPIN